MGFTERDDGKKLMFLTECSGHCKTAHSCQGPPGVAIPVQAVDVVHRCGLVRHCQEYFEEQHFSCEQHVGQLLPVPVCVLALC